MSLDSVPIEVVKKIFYYLLSDIQAYVSLASTCKLFNHIANEFQLTTEWKRFRPVTFHADQIDVKFLDDADCNCNKSNQSLKEMDIPTKFKSNSVSIKCYFNRLKYLINCRHRRFSTIRFESSLLQNLDCLSCFNDTRSLAKNNIESLVEVELVSCFMNFHWLKRLLSFLINLCYLSLVDITQGCRFGRFREFEDKEESAKRRLELLKLNGNVPGPLYLEIVNYFVTSTLDVSNLTVKAYATEVHVDPPLALYRQQLSVLAVLPYVKNCQPILKHLILDRTNIEPAGVKRILRDDDLKDLRITVRDCHALTEDSRNLLIEELYEDELARVTF